MNIDKISFALGLHDLGKLDELWQGERWANAKEEPLAHFPFRLAAPNMFEGRNHAVISAFILKDYYDKIIFNAILQHHRRYINDGSFIQIKKFKLDYRYKKCLEEYGVKETIINEASEEYISFNDVLNPACDEWNDFLFLVGTLMESDIESVNCLTQ